MKESNAAWWESVNKMLGPDPNQKFHDGWTEYQKDSLFTPVDTENLTQAVRPEPQAGDVGFAPVGKLGNDLSSNSVEEGSITSMQNKPKRKTGPNAQDRDEEVTADNESGEDDPKASLHKLKRHILQGRKPKSIEENLADYAPEKKSADHSEIKRNTARREEQGRLEREKMDRDYEAHKRDKESRPGKEAARSRYDHDGSGFSSK